MWAEVCKDIISSKIEAPSCDQLPLLAIISSYITTRTSLSIRITMKQLKKSFLCPTRMPTTHHGQRRIISYNIIYVVSTGDCPSSISADLFPLPTLHLVIYRSSSSNSTTTITARDVLFRANRYSPYPSPFNVGPSLLSFLLLIMTTRTIHAHSPPSRIHKHSPPLNPPEGCFLFVYIDQPARIN